MRWRRWRRGRWWRERWPSLLLTHPSSQVVELQRVERELGRQLSKEEHEFVDAQLEKRGIQSIKAAKRSDEQSTRLKKLDNFINHAKKQLQDPLLVVKKAPAKTPAQRKATPEQREADRVRLATPEQREASRLRKATPEQMEATRLRMATADQMEATRVRMVGLRAGGLSEDRRRDVEAGRKKNKKTSVYSGDALRNCPPPLRSHRLKLSKIGPPCWTVGCMPRGVYGLDCYESRLKIPLVP